MVLLVFRMVRSGRKSCVVNIGDRIRVFTVSAQLDGAIVATGPVGQFGEGTMMTPLSWQVCGCTAGIGN